MLLFELDMSKGGLLLKLGCPGDETSASVANRHNIQPKIFNKAPRSTPSGECHSEKW